MYTSFTRPSISSSFPSICWMSSSISSVLSPGSKLTSAVTSHDGIEHVDDFRSMFIGAGKVLVTADVSFDPGLSTEEIDEDIQQIEGKLEEIDGRVKLVYIEPEM